VKGRAQTGERATVDNGAISDEMIDRLLPALAEALAEKVFADYHTSSSQLSEVPDASSGLRPVLHR